jgi:hypothetical protein
MWCTLYIKGAVTNSGFDYICVWQQYISYMQIYLKWIFPIVFNSVTSMFYLVMLVSLLCSGNKSLYRTGKASGNVFVKRIISY